MEKENVFIDEESYQQFKKDICKTDDYFTAEEFIKLRQNYDKYKNKVIEKQL